MSKNDAYDGRVSLTMNITSSNLTTINNFIKDNDSWSVTNNCSSFASKLWNKVASSSNQVKAGSPNTPNALTDSIKSKSGYKKNKAVSYSGTYGYSKNGDFYMDPRLKSVSTTTNFHESHEFDEVSDSDEIYTSFPEGTTLDMLLE